MIDTGEVPLSKGDYELTYRATTNHTIEVQSHLPRSARQGDNQADRGAGVHSFDFDEDKSGRENAADLVKWLDGSPEDVYPSHVKRITGPNGNLVWRMTFTDPAATPATFKAFDWQP